MPLVCPCLVAGYMLPYVVGHLYRLTDSARPRCTPGFVAGSMLPFAVRYLYAELPNKMGNTQLTLERLYSLRAYCLAKVRKLHYLYCKVQDFTVLHGFQKRADGSYSVCMFLRSVVGFAACAGTGTGHQGDKQTHQGRKPLRYMSFDLQYCLLRTFASCACALASAQQTGMREWRRQHAHACRLHRSFIHV